jgi:hypothetical protein
MLWGGAYFIRLILNNIVEWRRIMKLLATYSTMAAIVLGIAPASAKSVWDQLGESAPRSVFTQIHDSAPRSIFDQIGDAAPVGRPEPEPVDLAGE